MSEETTHDATAAPRARRDGDHQALDRLPPHVGGQLRARSHLGRERGGDAELRAEVESPPAADETPTEKLLHVAPAAAQNDPPRVAGERSYELVEELGRGGMGTVYRARRADGELDYPVAVKLIRRDLASGAFAERLRAECRVLARLNHPNVARLLDGGSNREGEPFLVMELVDGEPIDRYCEHRNLGLRRRLELLRDVCRAVHHAHQKLVIHGDLKPGNVLVSDDGRPKLLDFGIAQLLPRSEGSTAPSPALTPSYASPEQVRGEPLTTASDVYSLGVLLYELLTGRRPYGEARGEELRHAICEQQPPAPSAALLAAAGDGATRRRARRLRGDLDAIVAKALAKDPAERYPSAEELAADLTRHLDGFPVAARDGGPPYRAGRLIRRHRLLSALSALLVVALLAFAVTARLQAERTARQRDRAEGALAVVADMFEVSDPDANPQALSAQQIVDRGLELLDGELAGKPEVAAVVAQELGRILRNQGRYQESVKVLERAVALRRALYGERHLEVASALGELGTSRIMLGDPQAAERSLRQAERLFRQLGHDLEAAAALNGLGLALEDLGRLAEAEETLLQALATYERLLGAEHPDLADVLSNLGQLYHDRGDLAAAERYHRRALELRRKHLDAEHPDVGESINNLALVFKDQARYEEAEPLLRQALHLYRARLGDRHPDVGIAWSNLGNLLREKGDLAGAEQAQRRALSIFLEAGGEDNVDAAIARNNLARTLLDRDRPAAAVALLEQAAATFERQLGAGHVTTAAAQTNLARALLAAGRLADAEPLLKAAEAVFRSGLGDQHPRLATNLHLRGEIHAARGEMAQAETLLSQALEIREASLEPDHLDLADSRAALGRLLVGRGRREEGVRLLEKALAVRRAQLPAGDPRIVELAALLESIPP
ncbi:MAG: hypothetical protein D6696_06745 [Acidobacteria bacterium]|nr:MAG: hypothetical protein D6696_06745 [Acidobacteriota bacterium]